ncbi:hypothetical protein FB451DRAFT_1451693 [Mycena latifolia]|nr:hypothetical protein FB451DRAFT_1451693 [Mycena latifolia]
MMENTLNTEYEGSLFTPPGSPTSTSAPPLPSATAEGLPGVEEFLDNWDGVLGDDRMLTFVAKGAADTAPALSPPISGSQSGVAKPLGRALVGTAPTLAAAQWQTYSLPNYHLESGSDLQYEHAFAPLGLPPLPVWPDMEPAASASEHQQTMARHVPRSMLQAPAWAPMGVVDVSHIDRDTSQALVVPPSRPFRGHGVTSATYLHPRQMGPHAHALPPCGTTSGLFDAYLPPDLSGRSAVTTTVARATATDAAYDTYFTHFSHYPMPPPQAPGGIYDAHSTQVIRPRRESPVEEPQPSAFERSRDAYGQLPAQPTASDIQRFIPPSQQFAVPPSSAPQNAHAAAPSSWARPYVPRPSGNGAQMSAASSSRTPQAGSSARPSAAQFTSQTKPPNIRAAPSPGAASTSGVPPGLTAWPKKRPAPAALPMPLGPHSLEQILEMAKPNHGNQSYACQVSTMTDGTPSSCRKHDMQGSPAGLQRHLAECHGFPDAAQAKCQHRTYAACVWDSEKPCYKLVALDKMGSHIANCHLKSHYYPCGYCGGQFASKRKYADHFAQSAGCLAHVSAREGPPEKRRRVDDAGEGDF